MNRDYFMVSECVRFLFTSCEGSSNERVHEHAQRTSEFSDPSQRVNNKNHTNEPTMK